jgi:hypothetical protein
MRGLLIVLCTLGTVAATLAGGCGLLFSFAMAMADQNRGEAAGGALMIALPVLAVTGALALANIALIAAIANGRAPRRNVWFLLLAIVDLAIASVLAAAGFAGQGPVNPGDALTLFLPVMLAVKGGLTLLLPAQPRQLPPGENPEEAA